MNYFGRDKGSSRAAYKSYVIEGLKGTLSNPYDQVKSLMILGSKESAEMREDPR
jgi:hypothetical protein